MSAWYVKRGQVYAAINLARLRVMRGPWLVMVGSAMLWIAWTFFFALGPALAAGGLPQRGAFAHAAWGPRVSHTPLCRRQSCDGKNPYAAQCAGQSWDSWWMLMSTPLKDHLGRRGGYVELSGGVQPVRRTGRVWLSDNIRLRRLSMFSPTLQGRTASGA